MKLKKTYCYSSIKDVQLGQFVFVNFNGKIIVAVVYKIHEKKPHSELKEVLEVLDLPPLNKLHIKFLEWVAYYTLMPIGLVLKMCIVKKMLSESIFVLNFHEITDEHRKISQLFSNIDDCSDTYSVDGKVFRKLNYFELIAHGKIKDKMIQHLIVENVIKKVEYSKVEQSITDNIILSVEQQHAYDKIAFNIKNFSVFLLDGITGSGKTEIYLKVVINVLKNPGVQALIMVPEIGLTTQTFEKFQRYFGNAVETLEWHSGIKPNLRYYNWQKVLYGRSRIVVGARSALFLPYKNLKIVVVDEEHDSSYKDDQGEFAYNARDMAIARAKILDIPIILSSATPSVETINNALQNKFLHVILQARYGGALLPKVMVVDMHTQQKITEYISEQLYQEIKKTISLGRQALLFLNRRGYAPIVMCTACGKKIGCPNCSLWLVKHKNTNVLQCHMCSFMKKYLAVCPSCNAENKLKTYGLGIEQIQEEMTKLFNEENVLVLSSDNTDIKQDIADIVGNKYSIIISTQIASKGYNFPYLRLVGIIDADNTFYGGDLRSSERTFQVMTQVMGRSGRSVTNEGIVVLQTYNPKSPLISAIAQCDKKAFYETELQNRKEANMPPFTRLISITFSSKKQELLISFMQNVSKFFKKNDYVTIFGPSKAPIYYCKNYYRYKFLFISSKNKKFDIHSYIKEFLDVIDINTSKIKAQIDVDPINFL